jgi:Domain of unknown function (DUF4389)
MAYPADLELDAPVEVDNWRPLAQWFLAIPHLLIAAALSQVAEAVAFISWFIIVFTGALPVGLANFQCMIIRYTARAYSYAGWLRESYPPFEFELEGDDPDTDPVKVDIDPALTDRDRLTVGLRFIWLIPAAIWAALLAIAVSFAYIAAFFVVLFTGRWSDGLRDFVIKCARYFIRFSAYCYLLNDEYPPFALEEGRGGAATSAVPA